MASPKTQSDGAARRGRPRRISRSQIVEAAVALGPDSFSLQGIADHLGVTAPALYTHVSGRDEIAELVAAHLMERVQVPVDESTDWREWLLEFGHQARLHFGDTGALQAELTRNLEVGERGLRLLIDAGFSPADAGRALWLVFRVACSAGSREQASVRTPMTAAREVAQPGSLPAIEDAIEAIGSGSDADTFEFDLRVLVAGLESELSRRPA